jgi:hypothetical protein
MRRRPLLFANSDVTLHETFPTRPKSGVLEKVAGSRAFGLLRATRHNLSALWRLDGRAMQLVHNLLRPIAIFPVGESLEILMRPDGVQETLQ